jgi:RsiW-degrading membrane proteinase PrsW (M82 family)
MREALYLIFAIIPAVIWIYYFYKKDKGEPEPIRLLFIAFFVGAIVVIPAAYLEIFITKNILSKFFLDDHLSSGEFLSYFILLSFVCVAIVEELFKYLAVRFTVYYSDDFNEYADGIIYIVAAALGFAAFENFLYFLNFGPDIVVARSLFTPLFHASASSVVGHYMIQMKFSRVFKKKVAAAFIVSSLIHVFYNILVYSFSSTDNYWYLATALLFLVLLGIWMIGKFKEAEEVDEKCWECNS